MTRILRLYGSGSAYVKQTWYNFHSQDENRPTSGGSKRCRRSLKRRQRRIETELINDDLVDSLPLEP